MSNPDFIIIGAAKSGTTSVSAYCSRHPEIFMSPLKEARFLGYDGETPRYRGYGRQGDALMARYCRTIPKSWEDYQALFVDAKPGQKTGEASPAYLYLERAPGIIRKYVPDAKLIVILRNPAERAFSSYLHLRRENSEDLSFESALDAEAGRITENAGLLWRYLDLGFYGRQIKRYLDYFPPAQLKILLYDDLVDDQENCLGEIFSYIGVDPTFRVTASDRFNVSGIPRNRILYDKLTGISKSRFVSHLAPQSLKGGVKKWVISALLKKPNLDSALRDKLILSYREDLKLLESLLKRDLSKWLSINFD